MASVDSERDRAIHLLQSRLWSDRVSGAKLLGTLGGDEAVDALITLVSEQSRAEDTAVLQAAICSLERIGDPKGIPALTRIANWPDPLSSHEEETRDAARSALIHLRGAQ